MREPWARRLTRPWPALIVSVADCMKTDGATPPTYARLADTYWLDMPHAAGALCECPLDAPPARGGALCIRIGLIGLTAGLILFGLVCTVA